MDEKRKKVLMYGGGLAVLAVVVYVVLKNRQTSTAGQPDATTLGQYAAVFRGNGAGAGAGFVGPPAADPGSIGDTAITIAPRPGGGVVPTLIGPGPANSGVIKTKTGGTIFPKAGGAKSPGILDNFAVGITPIKKKVAIGDNGPVNTSGPSFGGGPSTGGGQSSATVQPAQGRGAAPDTQRAMALIVARNQTFNGRIP